MIKVDNLAPCIIFSIIIHSLVFGTIYYKNNKKNVFVQVPFEVSFYSPVQQTAMKEVVECSTMRARGAHFSPTEPKITEDRTVVNKTDDFNFYFAGESDEEWEDDEE